MESHARSSSRSPTGSTDARLCPAGVVPDDSAPSHQRIHGQHPLGPTGPLQNGATKPRRGHWPKPQPSSSLPVRAVSVPPHRRPHALGVGDPPWRAYKRRSWRYQTHVAAQASRARTALQQFAQSPHPPPVDGTQSGLYLYFESRRRRGWRTSQELGGVGRAGGARGVTREGRNAYETREARRLPGLSESHSPVEARIRLGRRRYIIPPMSGMPPGMPPPAPSFSGGSAMIASVTRMFFAIEAAFCSADRVTIVGSITPAAIRSP